MKYHVQQNKIKNIRIYLMNKITKTLMEIVIKAKECKT